MHRPCDERHVFLRSFVECVSTCAALAQKSRIERSAKDLKISRGIQIGGKMIDNTLNASKT